MERTKRLMGSLLIAGVVSAGAVVAAPAQPASAMVCGYSVELEKSDGGIPGWVPIIGGISWKAERQVGHWGNCTKGNQKVKVTTSGGSKTVCVTPGDTRLGLVKKSPKVTGATKLGTC